MAISKLLKCIVVSALALLGLKNVIEGFLILLSPIAYSRDVLQDYLLARAVLTGRNPYLPLQELATILIGSIPFPTFLHSSTHPPPVAILWLPLGFLTYEQSAIIWSVFEVACIVISIYLLLHESGFPATPVNVLLVTLIAFAWEPFAAELAVGQLMAFLLLLLIISWQALRSGKAILGGAMLGCAISLKLIVWPIIILLMLRRNWRAVSAAGAVVAVANLIAALFMGFDNAAYYYLKVGATIAPLYRAHIYNFSTYSIGWRIFEGTSWRIPFHLNIDPLVYAPHVAPYISLTMTIGLLILGLVLAKRSRGFDVSFGILVCVSILVSPVAWSHYLTLASIPIAIIVRDLSALGFPKRETYIATALSLSLFLHIPISLELIQSVLTVKEKALSTLPFVAGLPSLTPLINTLGLIWLMWHLDHISSVKIPYDHRRAIKTAVTESS